MRAALGSENSKRGLCAFVVLPGLGSAAYQHRTEDGVPRQDERRTGARQDGRGATSVHRPGRYINSSYKCCMLRTCAVKTLLAAGIVRLVVLPLQSGQPSTDSLLGPCGVLHAT